MREGARHFPGGVAAGDGSPGGMGSDALGLSFCGGVAVGLLEGLAIAVPVLLRQGPGVLASLAGFLSLTALLYGGVGVVVAALLIAPARLFRPGAKTRRLERWIAPVSAGAVAFGILFLRNHLAAEQPHSAYSVGDWILRDGLAVAAGVAAAVAAAVLAAVLTSRSGRTSGRALAAVVLGLLVAAGAHLGGDRLIPAGPANPGDRPNVLILGLDTLRADRLGCYGYERPTSPNIDRLAAEGVLFENHFNLSSLTGPSHAQLFTSTVMESNGVVFNSDALHGDAVTIFEELASAGYAVGGFSSNPVLSAKRRYDQGFDAYQSFTAKNRVKYLNPAGSTPYLWRHHLGAFLLWDRLRRPDVCTEAALDWLKRTRRRPVALWVQWIDPHTPLEPQAPFAGTFTGGIPARVDGSFATIHRIQDGAIEPDAQDIAWLDARYDEEVLQADYEVGRVLEAWAALDRGGDSLTIFWADHGENLYEHFAAHGGYQPDTKQVYNHGLQLYDNLVRTPLLLRHPGVLPKGLRVREFVTTLDVAPTVSAAAGLVPAPSFEGRDLAAVINGRAEPMERVFANVYEPDPPVMAVRTERWKLIADARGGGEGPVALELYDLTADPDERRDILEANGAVAESLLPWIAAELERRGTAAFLEIVEAERAQALDAETEQIMRALGYLR